MTIVDATRPRNVVIRKAKARRRGALRTLPGTWDIDVHGADGKRHRQRVRGSYQDAQLLHARMIATHVAGLRRKGSGITLRTAIDSWAADPQVKGRAKIHQEVERLRRFAEWYGPERRLDGIDQVDLGSYGDHLLGQGLTGRTVRRYLTTISSLFRYHIQRGRLEDNPVRKTRKPPEGSTRRFGLPPERVAEVLELVRGHPQLEPTYLLAYCAGLRLSEITRCRWEDMELGAASMGPTGRLRVRGSKTARSSAWVPMIGPLLAWAIANRRDEGPVVRSAAGRGYRPDSLQNTRVRWMRAHPGTALPTFHLGRHSIADFMVRQGASWPQVAAMLRNTSAVVEANYGHLRVDEQRGMLAGYLSC